MSTLKRRRRTWRNLLLDAADIIQEKGWTRGVNARAGRSACNFDNPAATCFCASGAIWRARLDGDYSWSTGEIAMSRLRSSTRNTVKIELISVWNDKLPSRTGRRIVVNTLRAVAGAK